MNRTRVCTDCGLEVVLKPRYPIPTGVISDGEIRCLSCRYIHRSMRLLRDVADGKVASLHKVRVMYKAIRRQMVRAINKSNRETEHERP